MQQRLQSDASLDTSEPVVVIGGGHAGLCAAIEAREAGAKVVLLDRAPAAMRGGNSRHTRNLRAMHDGPIAYLQGSYSETEFFEDLLRVTAGNTNADLAHLMIRNSAALLSWLMDHGVVFQPSLRGTLSLSKTNAFFLGGGTALLNALYDTALKLGVEVRYDCEVRQLDIKQHRCIAVQARQKDHELTLPVAAVVLASGGFQANLHWLREIWGAAADNFLIRGTPYNDGKVLQLMMQAGAATVAVADQCHAVAIDARAPKFDGGIVSRLDCVPMGIVVNKQGLRFYDEGEDFWPKRYAIWGRLVADQPEQIAYAIHDHKVANAYMPGAFAPITGDTLEELAGHLELAPEQLINTITQFNHHVVPSTFDPQVLDACQTQHLEPKKSHWAQPIDTPPFYAYPLRPGITFTYLGLAVDASARVQHSQGGGFDNIYAAGEIMAGNILGQGYCAGTGMSIGGVFGRIAGQHAACQT